MKRRLLIIGIFLLLGAVVNVAVAWGVCVASSGKAIGHFPRIPPSAAQRLWDRYAREGWPPFTQYQSGTRWGGSRARVVSITSHVNGDGEPRWLLKFFVGQQKVGWPIRTLQSGRYFSPPSGVVPVNGWLVRRKPPLIIPYEPLWPGFTINTLFYAAILWLLIPGPFVLRRFLRLRRGLCPKCAYPMGESSVCTECGRALPKRLRPAT